jgi:UDP-N-acetyl-D-glucosamine dehydrogenase
VTKVVVVGLGYVGLPLAMRAVEVGHQVVGIDVNTDRVKRLESGDSYVEDIASYDLQVAVESGRLTVSTDAAVASDFDVAVITVPTPLREGNPDLSYVEDAGRALAPHLRAGATVVLESTTYPGTTEELLAPLLEAGSGMLAGTDFHLGYSPERIDPGNLRWNFAVTPKVVSGVDPASLAAVQSFYDGLVAQTVPVHSVKVAELTKLLENTFRHVNIALVNELAMFAHALGIDVWEAIDAAETKPFGFMPFRPGPGVGGHCLPIDPSYLSWRVRRSLGESFRFVELANDINEHMPEYVVQRLIVGLNREAKAVRGARILLLGLAYKKNTGDVREAPSEAIVERLLALGAEVRGVDPLVVEHHLDGRVVRVDLTADELRAADAVVVLTDHEVFDFDLVARESRYVLDCRRTLDAAPNVEHL